MWVKTMALSCASRAGALRAHSSTSSISSWLFHCATGGETRRRSGQEDGYGLGRGLGRGTGVDGVGCALARPARTTRCARCTRPCAVPPRRLSRVAGAFAPQGCRTGRARARARARARERAGASVCSAGPPLSCRQSCGCIRGRWSACTCQRRGPPRGWAWQPPPSSLAHAARGCDSN